MNNQSIFQEETELQRLAVQNRLLYPYEAPVLEEISSGRSGLSVLDIGCNNGRKTAGLFSSPAFSRVIGLEYSAGLAEKAQSTFGSEKFSFFPSNVESLDFSRQLRRLMDAEGISGFDVIYLSFLLMHLEDPGSVLSRLRPFLAEGGRLVVVEANDSASSLLPRGGELLTEFLNILEKDPYSGNRTTGRSLPRLLSDCGYEDIILWHDAVSACGDETDKKRDVFTTFFSYLPEDVEILLKHQPEHSQYLQWSRWLREHYASLEALILDEDSAISMGMRILSCTGGAA